MSLGDIAVGMALISAAVFCGVFTLMALDNISGGAIGRKIRRWLDD
jgi:hypothetical protein